MHKVTIRIGEYPVEIENVSIDEVAPLLQQIKSMLENQPKQQTYAVTASSRKAGKSPSGRALDTVRFEQIFVSKTEARGLRQPSKYELYRERETGILFGRIVGTTRDGKSHVQTVTVGDPMNSQSLVYQATSAVRNLPIAKTFTRNDMIEWMPDLQKRGEILKFILDYIESIGIIEKVKEKDIASGGLVYRRKVEGIRSSSSNNVISNALEHSP